jgi:ComF family protein
MKDKKEQIKAIFKKLVNSINNLVAPRYCEVCKELIDDDNKYEFICQKCFDKIPLAPEPDEIFNRLVNNFPSDDLAISNAYSLFSIKEDHDYMNIIYSFKYTGFSRIGKELGRELAHIISLYSKNDYDAIVPVPIHHARMRERGFNQSEYIARGIASELQIPVANNLIKRKQYTQTQTKLSRTERKTNILKAIDVYKKGNILKGKKYLLVDDVLTTGSTLNVCAETLLIAGALRVDVATLVFA